MQIDSNQLNGRTGLCDTASCGGRRDIECVNEASTLATRSGDYLQIEGAFSLDTGAGTNSGTRGGGGRKEIHGLLLIGILYFQMRFVLIITVASRALDSEMDLLCSLLRAGS